MSDGKVRELIEIGYDKVYQKDVGAAVQICARIARKKGDLYAIAYFICLQEHAQGEAERNFVRDVRGSVDVDALARIFEFSFQRAIKLRTLPDHLVVSLKIGKKKTIYPIGSNFLESEIFTALRSIENNRPPAGMSQFDTAHFFNESKELSGFLLEKIKALELIKSRILTACSEYFSQIEREVESESSTENGIIDAQERVKSFLRATTEQGYDQFLSAITNMKPGDGEHISAAMSHLRRCIKSVADFVYPPVANSDSLSEDKHLNRISKFLHDCEGDGKFEPPVDLKAIEGMLRNLHNRASKGVHGSLTYFEAQQVLIASVLYLMNVSTAWEKSSSLQQ